MTNKVDFSKHKSQGFLDAGKLAVHIGPGEALIPIGPWVLKERPEIINEMWLWRCKNARYFFFDQPPTFESYTNYLTDGPVLTKERILFLVVRDTKFVGHLGLAVYQEDLATIDNVLRGVVIEDNQMSGIMERAMDAMISWARDVHGIRAFDLEVRSDNTKAIEFYERLGFISSEYTNFEHNGKYRAIDLQQHSPPRRIVLKLFIQTED